MKSKKISPWITLGLLALTMGFVYYPTFLWMVDRWQARDSYFGHGFLIPIITGWWVLRKWKSAKETGLWDQTSKTLEAPSVWVVGLFIAALVLQVAASILRIYFLSGVSFVALLLSAMGLLYGKRVMRDLSFPILFLLTMVPLPLLAISQITLQLKFFISQVATQTINWMGIQAIREGSYIYTPNSVLLVGDPCSGLRSFLAFLCLGLIFAYESKLPTWKRLILVASGFPLAILSNLLRVVFLGLVGEIYGMEYTAGFLHDTSGIAVFVLAFLAFLWIKNILEVHRETA